MTGKHTIWSGEGAKRFGGRWNPLGMPAIYAGTSFAVSLLEILVHANRKSPPSAARYVEATVPDGVSREVFDPIPYPGWDAPLDVSVAQAFGGRWLSEKRTAILIVPSIVTGGRDLNVVVNPEHPDAANIDVGTEMALTFDPRLFSVA